MQQYFGKFHNFLLKQSKAVIIIMALTLVILLGWLDYFSGFEIAFSSFYLIPIMLTVIYLDLGTGFAIVAFSMATWTISNQLAGEEYTSEAIRFWNAFVWFITFSLFVVLLGEWKNAMIYERTFANADFHPGVENRRMFYRVVEMNANHAQKNKSSFAVAYIDLDSFKDVNDKLGHVAGDYLLYHIAQTMKKSLRKTDFVARMGSDEFAILLPNIDRQGAQRAMEKMQAYLANKLAEDQTHIAFSVGLAYFPVPSRYAVDDVVKKAVTLMQDAKMQGDGRIVFEQVE